MQSIIGRRLNGSTAPRPGPERERLCRPTESSRLADVERAVAAEFAELAAVSSSFKVSAGFPEEAYTACLDRLYERATDIYKRHGESHDLMPNRALKKLISDWRSRAADAGRQATRSPTPAAAGGR